ncbi:unnamed protein product, partial [Sphagnum balticum]
TPHQLQLMAADLAGSYTVGANIDLTNAMNNAGDVWGTNQGLNGGTVSGSGFVPIGTFTGSLNGRSVGGYDGFQGAGDVFDSYAIGSVTATGTNEGVTSGLSATGSGTSAGTGEATSTLQAALPTGFGVSNW